MITEEEARRAVNTIADYCDDTECSECAILKFCNERESTPSCWTKYKEAPLTKNDVVNHPQHYCRGGIETVDIIKAKMPITWFWGYLMGNILKYVTRANYKGSQMEDLKKAAWYLDRLITELEKDKDS